MRVALPTQRQPRHDHLVHVYETEGSLVARVVEDLAQALRTGAGALVVATPLHRERFAAGLSAAGLDVAHLRATGRYAERDAETTLAAFSGVDGTPEPQAFERVVGGLVRRTVEEHGQVHVFGEMVARLWGRGQVAGAVALEHLWNDLATTTAFRLCCAYPAAVLDDAGGPADVLEVLRSHTGRSRG